MAENNPMAGTGSDALFGGNLDTGKKAEEVLREGLSGEDILFKGAESERDTVASEILGEPTKQNEIVVADKPDTIDGVVEDGEEKNESNTNFDNVKDRLESLGNKFVRENNGRVNLIIESLKKEGLDFDAPEVEDIEYFGENIKRSGSGVNKRIAVATAASVVEDNVGAAGTKFDTVEKAKVFLRKIGVMFEGDSDVVVDDDVLETDFTAEETVEELLKKEKEKLEKVVSENENACVGLFMADFSVEAYNKNLSLIGELVKNIGGGAVPMVIEQYDANFTDEEKLAWAKGLFGALQTEYLNHILGEEQMQKIGDFQRAVRDLENDEVLKLDLDNQKKTIKKLRDKYRGALEKSIDIIAGPKPEGRLWKAGYADHSKNYLERKFGFVESEKLDNSDLERVATVFSRIYLQPGDIRININRTEWSDTERPLFESIVNLHDLSLSINSNNPPTSEKIEQLLLSADVDLKNVLNIRNGEGTLVVPKVLEIYSSVLHKLANDDKTEPVSIDGKNVKDKVSEKLRDLDINLSEDEIKFLVEIGRSVSGMLGIDSQYFYALEKTGVGESRKYKSLPYGSKGVLMNEAFNIVAIEFPNNPKIIPEAYDDLDLGVAPFVNYLYGSDNPFSASVDSDVLYSMIMALPIGTEYQNWVKNVIGASSAAKAERKMLLHPQDPIGQLKAVMSEYNYKGPGKLPYVIGRMKTVVNVFLEKRRKLPIKDTKTTEFLSGINTEFGLFSDDEALNEYLENEDLPRKDENDEDEEARKILSGVYGEKAKNDFIKSEKASAFYEKNPGEIWRRIFKLKRKRGKK